ncbi:glucose-6-phosphate isomerase [Halomonas dongshanensis]|uniref:Glucose-6-phosphate isomerase n=1 Tax=Halomonas dongshanensis TaxID=2890835 RepID=A0ABT2EC43_9GAMM|nr:glucose-6-phosphate isomerase [Halomonas dongshanensis]MCS2609151.1 glucose-6-phosphate isomerase [Halomonas dongshanensis]
MNVTTFSRSPRVYTPANALDAHAEQLQAQTLGDLLNGDPQASQQRAEELRFTLDAHHVDLHVDFSKQRVNEHTLALLLDWVRSCNLVEKRQAFFDGAKVNPSEQRAALHMAARWPEGETPPGGMQDAVNFCLAQRQKLADLVERLHAREWFGATGQSITDVVHIGVGGSDLGPKLISEALGSRPSQTHVAVHYVSTMDGAQLLPLMERLDPATTLVVLASKSFTTADTRFNVHTTLTWLSEALEIDVPTLCRHQLIGVSSRPDKMTEFGIPEAHQLVFEEWIGGRFSIWSPIGVSVAMQLGMATFDTLLAGAHAVDRHFLETPLEANIPVLMAAIGAWNTQFLHIPTHAILPYDGRLSSVPAYLQQLEMESNGKSVGLDKRAVTHATCPIIWGDVGPNGQHAFYQLLHQGSHTVSADFIAVAGREEMAEGELGEALHAQEQLTLANCLAQSQLFALGDDAIPAVARGAMAQGYRGNQPNSVILMKRLDGFNIGALLALYEHKVFVQSVLWNVNPFDQPGVELGKQLATQLYQQMTSDAENGADACDAVTDPSTQALLERIGAWRQ